MLAAAALVLLGLAVAELARRRSILEVAWPDECIYLAGARNLVERGTLNTNFYLTHSLLVRGYPHRDVHLPGYLFALAPAVAALGATLEAAAALNLLAFLAAILLVRQVARRVLEDEAQALAAAALFAVMPPYPGYLFVAYPELATSLAFLAGLAWLVSGRGGGHAFVAGLAYAAGALFRETLLLALPLYAARLERRHFVRGFLPGAVAGLLLLVAPFSRDRAIHPNAIYPSVLEEARRSDAPLATIAAAVGRNVAANLGDLAASDPLARAEDATLGFLALLALAPLALLRGAPPGRRRLTLAGLLSLAGLTAAVLGLYVLRERGGVWGGVRAYMTFAPVSLVLATPLLFGAAARARAALLAVVLVGFLLLDARQLQFFARYKVSNREDQLRAAELVEAAVDRQAPTRVVGRLFLYGLRRWPVEVVWSPPRDVEELRALERKLPFDYLVLWGNSPLRLHVIRDPRYLRVNRERGVELLVFRRLY